MDPALSLPRRPPTGPANLDSTTTTTSESPPSYPMTNVLNVQSTTQTVDAHAPAFDIVLREYDSVNGRVTVSEQEFGAGAGLRCEARRRRAASSTSDEEEEEEEDLNFPLWTGRYVTRLPPADNREFCSLMRDYDATRLALQTAALEFRRLTHEFEVCGNRIVGVQRRYVESGRWDLASTVNPIVYLVKWRASGVTKRPLPAAY